MPKKEKLLDEIRRFSEEFLDQDRHFVCVYGSYATEDDNEDSDVDLFFASTLFNREEFEKIRSFIVDLHFRNGIPLDNEVPYENKLLVTYEDLENAVTLRPFKTKEGKHLVPPITKDEIYLSSLEIKWRLLLNALTTPHLFFGGDILTYNHYRDRAEEAIVHLAYDLLEGGECASKDILSVLLTGPSGEEGELYLGYKKGRRTVVSHLEKIIKKYHKKTA